MRTLRKGLRGYGSTGAALALGGAGLTIFAGVWALASLRLNNEVLLPLAAGGGEDVRRADRRRVARR